MKKSELIKTLQCYDEDYDVKIGDKNIAYTDISAVIFVSNNKFLLLHSNNLFYNEEEDDEI